MIRFPEKTAERTLQTLVKLDDTAIGLSYYTDNLQFTKQDVLALNGAIHALVDLDLLPVNWRHQLYELAQGKIPQKVRDEWAAHDASVRVIVEANKKRKTKRDIQELKQSTQQLEEELETL